MRDVFFAFAQLSASPRFGSGGSSSFYSHCILGYWDIAFLHTVRVEKRIKKVIAHCWDIAF